MKLKSNRLSHLPDEIFKGTKNNTFCSYLIALEGWRRGLKLTWYSRPVKKSRVHAPGRLFSLSDGQNTHMFYKAKGDKVSGSAVKIGADKELTKKVLEKANIDIPKGKTFNMNHTDEEVINYYKEINHASVVVKPSRGDQGVGVIANIQSLESFKEAVNYVRNKKGFKDIIVEEFIEGEEHRFFIIEDEVVAIIKRIPANVIGDGINTVNDLIKMKNKVRRKNPRLATSLIKIDFELKQMLKKSNLNLDSILGENEFIYLREKSNISTGGDAYEVTMEIPDEIKQTAVNTLKALPDIPHGGLDMIIDIENKSAVVLEINPIPQIGSLVFPGEGQAIDIPSLLVDYYFPGTKKNEHLNRNVYFDFKAVLEPLESKMASEIVVIDAPKDVIETKKISIKGNFEIRKIMNSIKRRAIQSNLFGNCKNDINDNINIVVAGKISDINEFVKYYEDNKQGLFIETILIEEWEQSVAAGFILTHKKYKKKMQQTQSKEQSFIQRLFNRKN